MVKVNLRDLAAADRRLDAAIEAMKELIATQFRLRDEARMVAYRELNERLAAMNEFRDQLNAQAANFVTRLEHDAVLKQLSELRELMPSLTSRDEQGTALRPIIDAVQKLELGQANWQGRYAVVALVGSGLVLLANMAATFLKR